MAGAHARAPMAQDGQDGSVHCESAHDPSPAAVLSVLLGAFVASAVAGALQEARALERAVERADACSLAQAVCVFCAVLSVCITLFVHFYTDRGDGAGSIAGTDFVRLCSGGRDSANMLTTVAMFSIGSVIVLDYMCAALVMLAGSCP